jgi:SulP family sulfate permease
MSEYHLFIKMFKSPKSDIAVLLATFSLTVLVDLTVAIQAGVVLASILFMKRMADVTQVGYITTMMEDPEDTSDQDPNAIRRFTVPAGVEVFEVNGPFFFGAAEKLEATVERAQLHVGTVVIRLGRVPFMDATGMHTLSEIIERFHRRGIRVLLVEIQPRLERALAREAGVEVGGTLWADSLGKPGSDGDTYLNAMASETATMVSGMTGGRTRCTPDTSP